MFDIVLYKNKSEEVAFSKDLEIIATLSGTLKDASSIINPKILIDGNLADISEANYIYIMAFKRYYFIKDMVSVRSGLVEITAHVDVLSSFKDEILENEAIILRQENKYNLYLDDGSIKAYQNPKVTTRTFPNGFDGQSFVLAISGS